MATRPRVTWPSTRTSRRGSPTAASSSSGRRLFLDLVHLGRLVRQGGVVFLDDFQLPAIAQAASFCVTNLGWALEETSASDGDHHWAVLRTSVGPDTRPFDHHVDF